MNAGTAAGLLLAILVVLKLWKHFPSSFYGVYDKATEALAAILQPVLPVLAHKRAQKKAQPVAPQQPQQPPQWHATVRLIMALIVTAAFGVASVYMLFSSHADPEGKKWAYGMIGTIAGYWLK